MYRLSYQVQSIVLWKEGAIDGAVNKEEPWKTLNFEGCLGRAESLAKKRNTYANTIPICGVLVIMTRHLSVRPDRPTPSLSSAARQRTFLSSSSPSSPLSSLATSRSSPSCQLVAAAYSAIVGSSSGNSSNSPGAGLLKSQRPQRIRLHAGDHADRDGRRSSRCSSPASLRTLSDRSSLLSHELPIRPMAPSRTCPPARRDAYF